MICVYWWPDRGETEEYGTDVDPDVYGDPTSLARMIAEADWNKDPLHPWHFEVLAVRWGEVRYEYSITVIPVPYFDVRGREVK